MKILFKSKPKLGLTVVELLIAITTTSLLVVTFSAFLMNFWQFSIYQQADLDSLVQRLNVSDYLRENLGTSSGIINQNSVPDPNVGLKDPLDTTDSIWNELHAVPGTITNGQDGVITPVLYYSRLSMNNDNDVLYNGVQPYEDDYVIYLNNDTKQLKVRTLAHPATSGVNKKLTTCPPELVTNTCPADTTLIDDVESVERRFFSRSGNLLDWTSIFDPDLNQYIGPDNDVVEVIELKINVSKKALLQKSETTKNSTIIRMALRNR